MKTNAGSQRFQVNGKPLLVGAALVALGGIIGLSGLATGAVALAVATRRWVQQLETPPSELVRQQWQRTKAATQAGATAWHDGARQRVSS